MYSDIASTRLIESIKNRCKIGGKNHGRILNMTKLRYIEDHKEIWKTILRELCCGRVKTMAQEFASPLDEKYLRQQNYVTRVKEHF